MKHSEFKKILKDAIREMLGDEHPHKVITRNLYNLGTRGMNTTISGGTNAFRVPKKIELIYDINDGSYIGAKVNGQLNVPGYRSAADVTTRIKELTGLEFNLFVIDYDVLEEIESELEKLNITFIYTENDISENIMNKPNLMGSNPNTNINLNPEVTKAVSRLILKFMQNYQYGKEDAVFAIQQALKVLGYGLTNEALDMNDPVLVKLRANKPTGTQNTSAMPSSVKMAQKTSATTTKKLRDLMMTKSRLMQDRNAILRDMEQEAEIEGGPIADRYADELMTLDQQISKLDVMIAHIKGSGTSV